MISEQQRRAVGRRQVLRLGALAGAVGLAGCAEGDPPNFTIEDVETETVPQGEHLQVTATVENTGDEEGTRTLSLSHDGGEVDSTDLTLDGDEQQDVTLK